MVLFDCYEFCFVVLIFDSTSFSYSDSDSYSHSLFLFVSLKLNLYMLLTWLCSMHTSHITELIYSLLTMSIVNRQRLTNIWLA